jgi:hypothetical protein
MRSLADFDSIIYALVERLRTVDGGRGSDALYAEQLAGEQSVIPG